MNRLAQSGAVAIAAAALSGGTAVALSGDGKTGGTSEIGPTWGKVWIAGTATPANSTTLVGSGDHVTLWRHGAPLADVNPAVRCPEESTVDFRAWLRLANPQRIVRPVAVTFRYHVQRQTRVGWMQGRIEAQVLDGGRQRAFAEVAGGEQYVTVFAPAAELRARGGLMLRMNLFACGRDNGTGRLRLDAVEVVS